MATPTHKFGVNLVSKERVVVISADEFKKGKKTIRNLEEENNRLKEENRQLKNKIRILTAKICGQSDKEISKLELEMLNEDIKRLIALNRTTREDLATLPEIVSCCVSNEEKIDG